MTTELIDAASDECRMLASIIGRAGDKWSVMIVVLLGEGPMRFSEIKRSVPGISQRMLTFTVRGLERDGLLTRTVYPTTPPRVDYELTPLGSTLWKALEPFANWARANAKEIMAARMEFDAREDSA